MRNTSARITLGIETSCDETSSSVYHEEKGVLSLVTFSQIDLHKSFGGVLPEVASRSQLEKIGPVVEEALSKAHISLAEVTTIAVTHKPGLPGSLLVGVCFAKSLAFAAQKKLIGVNHLEGHAFSAHLEHTIPFPYLCLTASGGHTALYIIEDFGKYTVIGQTVDDAAGEAFDKISKVIGLGYPGGPIIEKYAQENNFTDVFNYPRPRKKSLDFSFSGLKTAVLYDLVKRNVYDLHKRTMLDDSLQLKKDIASSLLCCIADIFEEKIQLALKEYPDCKAIAFVGGVACNKYLKNRLHLWATRRKKLFFSPSPAYCTDNGAMIAFVGNYKAQQGIFSDFSLDIS